MNDRLSQVDWLNEFCDIDVNAAVQKFYDLVSSLFDSVPTVRSAVKCYPCWFTKDLMKMLKQKVRARVKFLRTKDPVDCALFAGLRKEFKARKRLCEEAYVDDIEEKVTVNTKAFFSYTKSLRKTNSMPSQVHYCLESAADPDSVCNLFAKYFASVFKHDSFQDFVANQLAPDFSFSDITVDEPIEYHYHVEDKVIEKMSSKKDLGVTFNRKHNFSDHFSEITKKSYQMIGFIFRSTQHFKRPESLIKLYNAYIRSRLEYCCSVWNPHYDKYKEQLEKIQRKFTRMLHYKFNWVKPDYPARLKRLKMKTLETRRLEMDELVLYKLIHNKMVTNLSSRFSIHQPQRFTRQNLHHLFYLSTPSSNVQLNSPIYRLQNHHNIYFKSNDIFNATFSQCKRLVKSMYQL
ncbi:hypothetical protein HA402_008680 [Bradysia odoriphaga]|nr:hypothetical protein HA402_008680 [Bradysia odoriphaga]